MKSTFSNEIEQELIFPEYDEPNFNSAGRKIRPATHGIETPLRRATGAFKFRIKKLKFPGNINKKQMILKGRTRLSYNSKNEKYFLSTLQKIRQTRKNFTRALENQFNNIHIIQMDLRREQGNFDYGMRKLHKINKILSRKLRKFNLIFRKNY